MRARYWYMYVFVAALLGVVLSGCGSDQFLQGQSVHLKNAGAKQELSETRKGYGLSSVSDAWVGGHLIIPAIDVNAPLEPVGVLTNGDMAVPSRNQWDGVGWYQYGPFPGSRGSAVIDGHLDRPGGLPAVFWRLHDLRVGDMVIVVDKNGKKLHFRVMQTTAYHPNAAPLQNIFGPKNGVFLNLITCAGQWVAEQHQTTLRLVVYTQLVS